MFKLPDLPYPHDALEPYMCRETMELHHDKHHQAYVDNGNKLLEGSGLEDASLEEVVTKSHGSKPGLFNNVGQHWNHGHFWQWLKPNGGGNMPSELEKRLVADFGSVDEFKAEFVQAGVTQFGSGWCWLVVQNGKLATMKTPNGENPLVHGAGITTILGCDVWEHAYYLDHRNKRPAYLKAFLDNLVNWERVAELLGKA